MNKTVVSQHGVEGYSGYNGTHVQAGWGEMLFEVFEPNTLMDMTMLMLGLQFNTTMPDIYDGTLIQNYAITEHPDMPGVQLTATCEVEVYSGRAYADPDNVAVRNFFADDGASAFTLENSGYFTTVNDTHGTMELWTDGAEESLHGWKKDTDTP